MQKTPGHVHAGAFVEMAAPVAFRHACEGEAEECVLMKTHARNIKGIFLLSKRRVTAREKGGRQTLIPVALHPGRLADITGKGSL